MSLLDLVGGIADVLGKVLDVHESQGFGTPEHDIHNNPTDRDGWGNRPQDGQGNDAGRNVWDWANNRRLHD